MLYKNINIITGVPEDVQACKTAIHNMMEFDPKTKEVVLAISAHRGHVYYATCLQEHAGQWVLNIDGKLYPTIEQIEQKVNHLIAYENARIETTLNVASFEQIKNELARRGYGVDNLWSTDDIDLNLESFNEDRETPATMEHEAKLELLNQVLSGEGTMQAINETISDFLTDMFPEKQEAENED